MCSLGVLPSVSLAVSSCITTATLHCDYDESASTAAAAALTCLRQRRQGNQGSMEERGAVAPNSRKRREQEQEDTSGFRAVFP